MSGMLTEAQLRLLADSLRGTSRDPVEMCEAIFGSRPPIDPTPRLPEFGVERCEDCDVWFPCESVDASDGLCDACFEALDDDEDDDAPEPFDPEATGEFPVVEIPEFIADPA